MQHYVEISLLPSHDLNLFALWSKVFQQLHLGFVEAQVEANQSPIGVSFPEYKMGNKYGVLGSKCRLFASDEATLERFAVAQRLVRLSDYVHCTSIRAVVPEKITGYAIYYRKHFKTNPERLARRYAKRHGLELATAFTATIELSKPKDDKATYLTAFRYCDMQVPKVTLPFIRLRSLSAGQTFCLWIAKVETTIPKPGYFSTYGLSQVTTIPEF